MRLTQRIAIQLHLVAQSCIVCSSRSRRPVRKLLDILSYFVLEFLYYTEIQVLILITCFNINAFQTGFSGYKTQQLENRENDQNM